MFYIVEINLVFSNLYITYLLAVYLAELQITLQNYGSPCRITLLYYVYVNLILAFSGCYFDSLLVSTSNNCALYMRVISLLIDYSVSVC